MDLGYTEKEVGDFIAGPAFQVVRPTNDQIVYLDLSEPDSVVLYGQEETSQGPQGLLDGLKELFGDLFAYFQ